MNYLDLTKQEIDNIETAITNGEDFLGYIPEAGLNFIITNFNTLHERGCLESNWIQAYLHASHFKGIDIKTIKAVFEQCDKNKLRSLYPLPQTYISKHSRISLFRGCASNCYQDGMSWTSSLDKAIWYAAQHREYQHYGSESDCSVYATTVSADEIYCYIDHNEPEFIVCPKAIWKIDIPQTEFMLNRPR